MQDFTSIRKRSISVQEERQQKENILIMIGNATCGRSAGSLDVLEEFNSVVSTTQIDCEIVEVGCIGLCYLEPVVCITKPGIPGIYFGDVTADKVRGLFESYVVKNNIPDDLVIGTIGTEPFDDVQRLFDLPVLKPQVRRLLNRCGFIDPTNFHDYVSNEGYTGLRTAFQISPVKIIEEVKMSGLRGRGGAGFPTWRKWDFCRNSESDTRYLICNADEGDPGAFMNRSLIEGDPHALIEGMIISGYAIGATTGYVYCRAEYPLALERLRLAIQQAEDHGLLGENILGSGFNFQIIIKEGAGAFVCGEVSYPINTPVKLAV